MEAPIVLKVKDGYREVIIGREVTLPDFAFIIGKDGVFISDKNPAHEVTIKADLAGTEEVKETAIYRYPTIPYVVYIHAINFFRAVFKEHKSEGCLLLTLNRNEDIATQQYEILIPEQKVGGASVHYEVPKLTNGVFVAASIHSHANFSAGQSGTDHKDEFFFDGIHITIGKVEDATPEIHQRLMIRGRTFSPKKDLIETVPKMGIVTPVDEWMKQVSKEFENGYLSLGKKTTTMSGELCGNKITKVGSYTPVTAKEILSFMEPE